MFKNVLTLVASIGLAAATVFVAISPASATPPSCAAFFSVDQSMPTGVMTCEVPAVVTALKVDATGAGGGYGFGGSSRASRGGNGGRVISTIPVTPGETLTVEVGEAGGTTSSSSSYRGGGGGGWTALLRGSTLLVVAGGGGGGGSINLSNGTSTTFQGGDGAGGGGFGLPDGINGSPSTYTPSTGSNTACSGFGGSTSAGGAACTTGGGVSSGAGSAGVGGNGVGASGSTIGANRWHKGTIQSFNLGPGSGGAGYFGGSGGANSEMMVNGGGSGGGGSSYSVATATYTVGNNGGSREGSSMTAPGDGFIQLFTVALAPTITSVTAGDTTADVAFTAPSSNGGYIIRNYEYSTDNGSSWTALNPTSTSSPFTISGLTNDTTYNVQIRAVTNNGGIGTGVPSNTVSVTPFAPSLAPITPGSNPNLPADGVPLGQSVLLVDGQLTSVTVVPNSSSNATALDVTGTGFTMTLKGLNATGQPLGLTPDGALKLENDRTAFVEGTGFKPNSSVEVYLFSTPRLLGTVPTDANGNFSGNVPVPQDIAPGRHTLQSNGFTASGSVRSLNLGVQLDDNATDGLSLTGSRSAETLTWGLALLGAGAAVTTTAVVRNVRGRRQREV